MPPRRELLFAAGVVPILAVVLIHAFYIPFLFVLGGLAVVLGGVLGVIFRARQTTGRPFLRVPKPLVLAKEWKAATASTAAEGNRYHTKAVVETPSINAHINELLALIVRDYIKAWYTPNVSPVESFVLEIEAQMRDMLSALKDRAVAIDLVDLIVKKILPKYTLHLSLHRAAYLEVRKIYMKTMLDIDLTESDELDRLIAANYRKGNLHRALSKSNHVESEYSYLRMVVDLILPHILPTDELKSDSARIMIREIIACKFIHPVLEMLADPDYINQNIDYFAGRQLDEQHVVRTFRATLDRMFTVGLNAEARQDRQERAEIRAGIKEAKAAANREATSVATATLRTFDDFLRLINECNTVVDAKRIRHQILAEYSKKEALTRGRKENEMVNGMRVAEVLRYLNRLVLARKKCERKIKELGGTFNAEAHAMNLKAVAAAHLKRTGTLTLRKVLKSNSALFYFMEYVERTHEMPLLQFLLTVEHFRPLVDTGESNTLVTDIRAVVKQYLLPTSPESIEVMPDIIEAAATFSEGQDDNFECLFRAYEEVYARVESDVFSRFLSSDLFYRYTSDPAAQSELANEDETDDHILTSGLTSAVSPTALNALTPSYSEPVLVPTPTTPTPVNAQSPPLSPPSVPATTLRSTRSSSALSALSSSSSISSDSEEESDDAPPTQGRPEPDQLQNSATVAAVGRELDNILRDKDRIVDANDYQLEKKDGMNAYDQHDGEDPEHMTSPGDLMSNEDLLANIRESIDNIMQKEAIVDVLIAKEKRSPLKSDQLRVLRLSKAQLQQELRELLFKRSKFELQQDKDTIQPGKWNVYISSSTTGYDEHNNTFALYLIEVHRADPDNPSGWVVAHRFREFHELHMTLRAKYPSLHDLDFPRKHSIKLFKMKSEFVEERRLALQTYLQSLVDNSEVCNSNELREFLCRRQGPMTNLPAKEFGDITQAPKDSSFIPKSLKRMTVLSQAAVESIVKPFSDVLEDVFSVHAAPRDAADISTNAANAGTSSPPTAPAPTDVSVGDAYDRDDSSMVFDGPKTEGFTTISEPLMNLVLELFEMKERSSYVRRQAVLLILQQILGGTIERKVVENINWLVKDDMLDYYVTRLMETMWPNGVLADSWPLRTSDMKEAIKKDARSKLLAILPDALMSMIGGENTRRGGVRLFDAFQSPRLNKHLVYTIFDEVIGAFFPDIDLKA